MVDEAGDDIEQSIAKAAASRWRKYYRKVIVDLFRAI
jgi:hypothetical protein